MREKFIVLLVLAAVPATVRSQPPPSANIPPESKASFDARMKWWNEARFGLFLHWGLYSIPAGTWKEKTDYGEWIRHSARIPVGEYDKFVPQFNPVRFNAGEWVRAAKEAGMKYIVITSKHHDGFCLFDSKYTDFDIMSTPFKRDVLKELAVACRNEGMRLCFYYSIMDWHHPDYLPRRDWETSRTTEGADFERYVRYVKNQLKELLTNYGDIGVLWFDGNWERTWSNERGKDLYDYVRSLSPNIIVNNRVGQPPPSESGVGFKDVGVVGDFGTPEQEVPSTGMPGKYWETCMTMNDHWGFNSHDDNWKSGRELIHTLADVASKGGNFLLNIGPTPEGVFPQPSLERLHTLSQWMKINGEAIYGTEPSPFERLAWGRCTQKPIEGGTRLYLHVFDWPEGGRLSVHGLLNTPTRSYLLSDAGRLDLPMTREEDAIAITLPARMTDTLNTVVVLDIKGKPDVSEPPTISADDRIFIDSLNVSLTSRKSDIEIRYTVDGSSPSGDSPIAKGFVFLDRTTRVTARCFRKGKPVSASSTELFNRVQPNPSRKIAPAGNGVRFQYVVGDWDSLPDFSALPVAKSGLLPNFVLTPAEQKESYGIRYDGLIRIQRDGVYRFFTSSDDGSRLWIDDSLIVDNDGLHGMAEGSGEVALAAGFHAIRVGFFQKTGDVGLNVSFQSRELTKQAIPDSILFQAPLP